MPVGAVGILFPRFDFFLAVATLHEGVSGLLCVTTCRVSQRQRLHGATVFGGRSWQWGHTISYPTQLPTRLTVKKLRTFAGVLESKEALLFCSMAAELFESPDGSRIVECFVDFFRADLIGMTLLCGR